MNTLTPFQASPEALKVVASLLQQHPTMQAGLVLISGFDQHDEGGAVEAHFEREHFMVGYDSPDRFSCWPRVELCGRNVPVAADALERLKGKMLAVQALEIVHVAGGRETRKFLVAA